MIRIKAGGKWLTLDTIQQENILPGLNEHEQHVVQITKMWLNGIPEFSFQTSGSTGKPKKITFRREQLIASAELTARALDLKPGFNALISLDTQFIAGAMMVIRSLVTGMNMIVRTPASNPLDQMEDPIDFAAFVPYQVDTILRKSPDSFHKIKIILIGGTSISIALAEALKDQTASCYATYGMTETITHIALQKLNGPDRQQAFHLLPGISATLDERGCLVIKASHLGERPHITNDLATILDETQFLIKGRIDDVINSGGLKIHPEKIERVVERIFQQFKIQRRFFITGQPHEQLGAQVVLVVEGSPLPSEIEAGIFNRLGQLIGKFEMPKSLFYIPAFRETATQKIDRLETMRDTH